MHACLVYALAAMPKVFESAEEKADIVHISLIDDEKPSAPPKREEPQPPIEQPKIPNEVPKEQPKPQKKPVVAQKTYCQNRSFSRAFSYRRRDGNAASAFFASGAIRFRATLSSLTCVSSQ